MKRLLLFCMLSILYLQGIACLNAYYRKEIPFDSGKLNIKYLLKMKLDEENGLFPYWTHGEEHLDYQERINLIDKIRKQGGNIDPLKPSWQEVKNIITKIDFRILSDYAMAELKLRRNEIAVKLLEELYKLHPREYNIVANLGTAYELIGQDSRAIEYLTKAIGINPDSHFGSEWIHIRILEEKISNSPEYSRIINLKSDPFEDWILKTDLGLKYPIDSLQIQIAYQLHERIFFISPPNKIVGQLVLDFADLVAWKKEFKDAIGFYDFALGYDSTLETKIKLRKANFPTPAAQLRKENTKTEKSNKGILIWISISVVVLFGLLFWLLKKR